MRRFDYALHPTPFYPLPPCLMCRLDAYATLTQEDTPTAEETKPSATPSSMETESSGTPTPTHEVVPSRRATAVLTKPIRYQCVRPYACPFLSLRAIYILHRTGTPSTKGKGQKGGELDYSARKGRSTGGYTCTWMHVTVLVLRAFRHNIPYPAYPMTPTQEGTTTQGNTTSCIEMQSGTSTPMQEDSDAISIAAAAQENDARGVDHSVVCDTRVPFLHPMPHPVIFYRLFPVC